jgi:hypothetical protein
MYVLAMPPILIQIMVYGAGLSFRPGGGGPGIFFLGLFFLMLIFLVLFSIPSAILLLKRRQIGLALSAVSMIFSSIILPLEVLYLVNAYFIAVSVAFDETLRVIVMTLCAGATIGLAITMFIVLRFADKRLQWK